MILPAALSEAEAVCIASNASNASRSATPLFPYMIYTWRLAVHFLVNRLNTRLSIASSAVSPFSLLVTFVCCLRINLPRHPLLRHRRSSTQSPPARRLHSSSTNFINNSHKPLSLSRGYRRCTAAACPKRIANVVSPRTLTRSQLPRQSIPFLLSLANVR